MTDTPSSHLITTHWDLRFMELARTISTWSKHPTTKVGCVIVNDLHHQLSGGYNGLPRGVDDSRILDQTPTSLNASGTVHAEANAVAAAARHGACLAGGIAYVTRPLCSQCAALLIQAGIKRVRFQIPTPPISQWETDGVTSWSKTMDRLDPKWAASIRLGIRLMDEARISWEGVEDGSDPS